MVPVIAGIDQPIYGGFIDPLCATSQVQFSVEPETSSALVRSARQRKMRLAEYICRLLAMGYAPTPLAAVEVGDHE